MLIYFLRHGDAASDKDFSDSERPLTETGLQQAIIVGTFLQMMKVNLDAIVSSPLLRAMQTALIVQEKVGAKTPFSNDLLSNGMDHQKLFQYLNDLSAASILLVGHIPHLEDVISLIIYGNYESEIELRKCSLAIVQVQRPILPGTGQLKQLLHVNAIAGIIKP